jgi:hypothetical protein
VATKKRRKKAHRRAGASHHRKTTHKRKVSGTTHRRRRRVSGANKVHDAILLGVGILAGAGLTPFLVQMVKTALGSNAATMPAWLIPAGGFATGMTGAVLAESMNNKLLLGAGAGMAAVGGVMMLNESGLINEPGISGTAFANNAAPGATAATTSIGCRKVGSPQRYVNNSVGNTETMAIGALYSN